MAKESKKASEHTAAAATPVGSGQGWPQLWEQPRLRLGEPLEPPCPAPGEAAPAEGNGSVRPAAEPWNRHKAPGWDPRSAVPEAPGNVD